MVETVETNVPASALGATDEFIGIRDGLPINVAMLAEIESRITALQTAINSALTLKANLASPILTGTPTTPTAAPLSNNTQIANTAYVDSAVSVIAGSFSEEGIQDIIGGMVSGNIETNISVVYDDTSGKLNFTVPIVVGDLYTSAPINLSGLLFKQADSYDCSIIDTETLTASFGTMLWVPYVGNTPLWLTPIQWFAEALLEPVENNMSLGFGVSGNLIQRTVAEDLARLNVTSGAAPVTATNVNAAGAVMESDYTAAQSTLGTTTTLGAPVIQTFAEGTLYGREAGGNLGPKAHAVAVSILKPSLIGPYEYWYPASGLYEHLTNGATRVTDFEGTVNKFPYRGLLSFSNTVTQYAALDEWLPNGFDTTNGQFYARFVWAHPSAQIAGARDVVWTISGRAIGHGGPMDGVPGTSQLVASVVGANPGGGAALTTYHTLYTPLVTLGGSTPFASKYGRFVISRDQAHASDTLPEPAYLLGVVLKLPMAEITDA